MHQLTPSRPAQAHVASPVVDRNVDDGALDGADTPALLTTPLRDGTNDLSVTAFGATNSVCRQPQQAMHWSPYMEAKQPLTSRRWAATSSHPRLTLSTTRTSCLAETAQIGTGMRAVQCGLGSARHVQPQQQQPPQQQEETKVEGKEVEAMVAAEAEEKAEAEAEEEEQEEDIGALTEQQEGPASQKEACTRGMPLGTEAEQRRPNLLQAQDLQQQRRRWQRPEESQEGREAGVAEEDSHEEPTVLTLQPSQTARTQQYVQAQPPEMTPTLPCAILAAVSVCAHQPKPVYLVLTQTLPVLQ
eukprot:COSAG01_NODE_6417_length_3677_cov_7.108720_5_plen_301_part_00